MHEIIKFIANSIYRLFSDTIGIIVSRERIIQLFRLPLYSNTFYLMTINALSALLGFVFWIIAARFYSAETVGVASAIIAAMGLMASFANLGLGHGLIRFLPNAGQKANSLINSSFTINILASLIVSLVFLAPWFLVSGTALSS